MRVLVFAAHPDDEVLGCGGSIARHIIEGNEVAVEILAEGITSRGDTLPNAEGLESLEQLRLAAERANRVLGVKSLRLHGLPDNRLDTVPLLDVVKRVESAVAEFEPAIVYTHHGGDLNVDHEVVNRAVLTACRPSPQTPVRTVLGFEVPSSTEWRPGFATRFAPTWFVDISRTLDMKLAALEAYASEMRAWPHARSLESVRSLALWRGATVGVEAAESFDLLRHVTKSKGP